MNRSRDGREPHRPGIFGTFSEFVAHVEAHCDRGARFHVTQANGAEVWVGRDEALDLLDRLRKFMSAPERAISPAHHDGRMIVAHHNVASLTQHLRWESGLDFDSLRERRPDGFERPAVQWPDAARLWFWANGHAPVPRLHVARCVVRRVPAARSGRGASAGDGA